jgi:aminopeptidase N
LSYVSDPDVALPGVFVDDVTVSTGEGSTGFEDDGDTFDGWTVAGAPAGSPGNTDDWIAVAAADVPSTGSVARDAFAALPDILAFESELFGPYPFRDAGGIVDDVTGLGFALENQTRPIYALDFFDDPAAADGVVVHENAHQWFGDSVSVGQWRDIWLNEGFATYAEWLRLEAQGGPTTADSFALYYNGIPADDPFWSVTIGDPGPGQIFDISVYFRGAMTLQVLRETVGDDAFFATLRTWVCENAYGNASVEDFIDLAEQISGQDLAALFQTWLFTGSKPVVDASAARAAAVALPWEMRSPLGSLVGPRK